MTKRRHPIRPRFSDHSAERDRVMKGKKETLILILIILVLSAYLVLQKKGKTHYILPELSPIATKDVTRLHIRKGEKDLTLKKVNDRWLILPREYPADPTAVSEMIDGVVHLNLTALASESGNYGIYELGDDKRIDVQLYNGEKLLREVGIGKVTSSRRQTFVRLPREKGVFHAVGNLVTLFDKEITDLRDKEVLTLKEDIQQVVLTQGEKTETFVKTAPPAAVEGNTGEKEEKTAAAASPPPHWQTIDGKAVKEGAIDEVVTALSNLRCDDFIDDTRQEADPGSPIYTVTLKGVKDYTVKIFAKEKNLYRAVSSETPYPFHLAAWKVERIMKNPAELIISRNEKEE